MRSSPTLSPCWTVRRPSLCWRQLCAATPIQHPAPTTTSRVQVLRNQTYDVQVEDSGIDRDRVRNQKRACPCECRRREIYRHRRRLTTPWCTRSHARRATVRRRHCGTRAASKKSSKVLLLLLLLLARRPRRPPPLPPAPRLLPRRRCPSARGGRSASWCRRSCSASEARATNLSS